MCACAAVGNDSLAAVSEWLAEASQPVLARLRARVEPLTGRRVPPSEATVRRVLTRVDPAALDAATCRFLADQAAATLPDTAAGPAERQARRARQAVRPAGLRSGLAVDGKTCRGARRPDGTQVHLLSAVRHDSGVTMAQREVPTGGSEVPEATVLLDGLDVAGMVVTTDALHTQRATARALVEDHHAHYLMVIKGNQPALLDAAATALAAGTDAAHAAAGTGLTTDDQGHGRRERRTLRVAPATSVDFPHAAQLVRLHRRSGATTGPWLHTQVVYAVTSLPAD